MMLRRRWAARLLHAHAAEVIQANSRTHRPQKLKCLISLFTNPVSILSVAIQNAR
jgi:hypothetical protein